MSGTGTFFIRNLHDIPQGPHYAILSWLKDSKGAETLAYQVFFIRTEWENEVLRLDKEGKIFRALGILGQPTLTHKTVISGVDVHIELEGKGR